MYTIVLENSDFYTGEIVNFFVLIRKKNINKLFLLSVMQYTIKNLAFIFYERFVK